MWCFDRFGKSETALRDGRVVVYDFIVEEAPGSTTLLSGLRLCSEPTPLHGIAHNRHSTVTLLAKFLGLSTSVPRAHAV